MAVTELGVNVVANVSGFQRNMTEVGKTLKKTGKTLSDIGSSFAKLTAPFALLGVVAGTSALEIDDALDKIRVGTGATGDNLKELEQNFKNVFTSVPVSADQASSAIAELNARTGLTGKPLEELATTVLNLSRITGEDLNTIIEKSTRMFGDWGISGADASKSLDFLFKVSQSTGASIDNLGTNLVKYGAPLRQFGIDFETSAVLMGKFEKEGVNTELVMGSLRIALGKLASEGVPLGEGLAEISKRIKEAGSNSEASAVAMEFFGRRAGADMAAAIREGRFEIDQMITSLRNNSESIAEATKSTDGFKEKLILLKNNITTALEPIGTILLNAITPALEILVSVIKGVGEAFASLPTWIQTTIAGLAVLGTVIGPVAMGFGFIITNLGLLLPLLAKSLGLIKVVATAFAFLAGASGIGAVVLAGSAVVASFSLVINSLIGLAEELDRVKSSIDNFTLSNNQMRESTQKLAGQGLDVVNQRLKTLDSSLKRNTEIVERLKKANLDNTDAYKASSEQISKIKSEISLLEKQKTSLIEKEKQGLKVAKESDTAIKTEVESLSKKKVKLSEAEKEAQKLADTQAELASVIRGDAKKALEDFEVQLKNLIALNPEKDIEELSTEISNLSTEALKAGNSIGEISDKVQEVAGGGDKNLFDSLFDPEAIKGTGNDIATGLNEEIGRELQNGFSDIFSNLLNGGSLRGSIQKLGSGIGSTIGSAIGGSIGGPMGAVLGSALGETLAGKASEIVADFGKSTKKTWESVGLTLGGVTGLGIAKGINHAFNNKSDPFANAREELANMFNAGIEKAREMGYEMQRFTDFGRGAFDPFVNSAGEATTKVSEVFRTLTAEQQQTFLELGTALDAVFQIENLESGQLGELLGANFGVGLNTLNDLQIALGFMGVTAEQAGQAIEQAFLMGDLSAQEFLSSQSAIQDLFAQGIPGAVGDTTTAFQNLIDKGLNSGSEALDALGDIGAEAMEKLDESGNQAIKSLDDLRAHLINSGHSVSDVDKFMQALASNGINSIEDLKNVTVQQTAGIISALQNSGFAFQAVADDIKGLRAELDQIKSKEIDVKVNVRYEHHGEPPPDGGEVLASAKGNVFSAGRAVAFAKGGVVSKMTAFDIGTMAERGPEAIMPLKRSATGELGVRLIDGAGKSEVININIDAKGAEIGVERKIENALRNFFEQKNRLSGQRV